MTYSSPPTAPHTHVPDYAGHEWVHGSLPRQATAWLSPDTASASGAYPDEASRTEVLNYLRKDTWAHPERTTILLSDVHADTDAFHRCLVASGGASKTGPGDADLALTDLGRDATFIIAGDCFDKGPENLRLLRAIKHLKDLGAEVVLLAGNHDVRAVVGMTSAGATDPRRAHLFVRMGKKSVPLFSELCRTYVDEASLDLSPEREAELMRHYYPDESWYRDFPAVAKGLIPDKKIAMELKRIREKTADFKAHCAAANLSIAHVDAAVRAFHQHFLQPGGDFSWFFAQMQLTHRAGSFLFVHAGVDDVIASRIKTEGHDGANRWYRQLFESKALFELYHGAVGNAFRTKYRETDRPLTPAGVADLREAGIHCIVHGHRNIQRGQRIIFRSGLLNIECDASVDINTRRVEGLDGPGGAATIFRPDGTILGVSTDYPAVKVFEPKALLQ